MNLHTSQTIDHFTKIGSKGNQLKILVDGKWYKGDYLGYEGAAEYLATEVLKQSNVSDFVHYNLANFDYKQKSFVGCVSSAIQNAYPNTDIVTLNNLFLRATNKTIEKQIMGKNILEKIEYIVNTTERITGIVGFGQYLSTLFEFDAFILNEDRHYDNITVLKKRDSSSYMLCPIFDNGAGFLSDTRNDYPLSDPIAREIKSVQAKPITKDFVKQVEAVERLYGTHFRLNKHFISNLSNAFNNIENVYGNKVRTRMEKIIEIQERKWSRFIVDNKEQESTFNQNENNEKCVKSLFDAAKV